MLGDEIRKARNAADLTQEQLAHKAGISSNYVSMLENNKKSPTIKKLTAICKVLGVRVSVLIARTERD